MSSGQPRRNPFRRKQMCQPVCLVLQSLLLEVLPLFCCQSFKPEVGKRNTQIRQRKGPSKLRIQRTQLEMRSHLTAPLTPRATLHRDPESRHTSKKAALALVDPPRACEESKSKSSSIVSDL